MKRFFTLGLMLLALMLTAGGCSRDKDEKAATAPVPPQVAVQPKPAVPPEPPPGTIFRTLSPLEAQEMLKNRPELTVVDLREPGELKDGYIDGSILIPVSDLSRGNKSLPADRPLLLVCAVGGRSYGVGRYFSFKGYREIYNLQGGIAAWKKAGLPLKY